MRTLKGLIKAMKKRSMPHKADRREQNWDFPIKAWVLSQTVYSDEEEKATEDADPPALVWISLPQEEAGAC